ncbi:MAG TPA: SH3 domain-containing protein, partial [Thermomicrobiales bacterium]|nr:SH3 domain-containing protein [Thermomicrobiales bacterium]
MTHHSHSCDGAHDVRERPAQRPARRLDRRTLLKATAAFLATATAAGIPEPPEPARAQASTTRAGEWSPPDTVEPGEWTEFDSDFTFNAIAPHWPGDLGVNGAVEMQLSIDGITWTETVVIGPAHTDAGPEDRDGRVFGDLLFAEMASVVRYRTIDTEGNPAGIPGLVFTYIDARSGPSIDDVMANSVNAKAGPRILSGSQSTLRPPMISRREWGAEQAYGGADKGTVWWTPRYQRVQHVIVHHSVTPQFRDPLVEIRSIHYYHTVTRGWGDIGYNYLVDFMGNVYEGRAGGENVIGGHAFQYARGSAGICTMGTYAMADATPEAIAGLTWITAWAARNLDPLGRSDFHETPNLPTICGHRDVVESTCPGDGLYADLPTVRQAVSDVQRGVRQVLLDPAYSPGETVQVTVNGANLRSKPGTGQSVLATLAAGTIMHVSGGPTTTNGYTWYELAGGRGTGWVASTMFGSSNAAPPVGRYEIGDTLEVDTDFLNIRSQPSIRSGAIATIPLGTKGTVIDGPEPAGGFRWYRLETSHGRGWAVEQYLVVPGTAKPRSRFVVGDHVAVGDRDGLRMRSGAGTGNSLVRSLPYGTRGTVIGSGKVADGLTWLQVTTSIGSGWVAERYLSPSDDGPSTSSKFSRGDRVIVDTDSVNLRTGPGTDRSVIRALGNGVTGTVVDPSSSASNLWW